MIKWFTRLFRIVKYYDDNQNALRRRITQVDDVMRDRTDLHVDYFPRGQSQIICVGRYKGVDYVQIYSLTDIEFSHLVGIVKEMEKHARLSIVDAPLAVKGVFKRNHW